MYRDRGDHRRRSHSVTFKGYLTRDELNNAKSNDPYEVRTNIRNITLRNKIKSNSDDFESDWYDFQVIVGDVVYFVDERTYRRLVSCQNILN